MRKIKINIGLVSLIAVIITGFAVASLQAQVSCLGQPYGTEGCPQKADMNLDEPDTDPPPNCADGLLNDDEECDAGRFNGLSRCTERCTVLYCGDDTVSPLLERNANQKHRRYTQWIRQAGS